MESVPFPQRNYKSFPCRTLGRNPEPDACRNEGIDKYNTRILSSPYHTSSNLKTLPSLLRHYTAHTRAPTAPRHTSRRTPLLSLSLQKSCPQLRQTLLRRTLQVREELGVQTGRAGRAVEGALRQAQRGTRGARACEPSLLLLLFCPREEGGDDLENLEFLGV
jgi:hypothetical protein